MRIIKFGLVSGTGLLIDFGLFKLLTGRGVDPMSANICTAAVAVTFVFFVSAWRVFYASNRFIVAKFLAYLGYQAASVLLFSWIIGRLSGPGGPVVMGAHLSPLVAKLMVTPVTFWTNYIFMGWLVTGKVRLV